MQYTASTAVPKTYTQQQVNVAFFNGLDLGMVTMLLVFVIINLIRTW